MTGDASSLLRRIGLVGVVVLTACASGTRSAVPSNAASASATSASPVGSPAIGEPTGTWVAVLDTAADPGRLNDARKDVLRQLGDVLEGSVVISPGACLQGLPDAFVDGYVLAIQRDSREDVRALVSLLSQEPAFTGDVTIMCSD